ncbi:hypothetical protein BGZ93_007839 [Podila epicladia]|nr:hypothetical protein BGZ92_005739 [Podila epicladia]KAG0093561.1 hypothetical protein BGZ93_007839 [Podila epicladia]
MAIIGDQSSGKSSVLEVITKLLFSRAKDMCTRFATLVNMHCNSALTEGVLSSRIEGEGALNAHHKVVEAPMTFQVADQGRRVGDLQQHLTQFPLTLIDLPGIISTTSDGEDKTVPDTISSINQRYIMDPRTIILAVVNASKPLRTTPRGERTISIVTKPARIESGLILDLIEGILNKRKTMKLGYLWVQLPAQARDSAPSRSLRGNNLPGFISFINVKNIVNGHYLDGWRNLTKEHVRLMHRYLSDALTGYIVLIADAVARDVFTHVFHRFSRSHLTKIEETIRTS